MSAGRVTDSLVVVKERPASREWGCAWGRCLRDARVVVTGPSGNEWGACKQHIKQVRKAMRDA